MAAIEVLDAAVVEAGGEVITLADRQAAITELDAAVKATEQTFPRLSKAVAQVQRLKAWTVEEGYQAALAAKTIQVPADGDHFVAFARHRYNWAQRYAYYMGAGGKVVGAIEAACTMVQAPANERQVRPLTRLIGKHEDSIPGVWEQARAEADDYLARHPGKGDPVARLADGIVRDKWPELFEKSAEESDSDLDAELRKFRKVFRSLYRRMNRIDFAERVIGWMNEEVAE